MKTKLLFFLMACLILVGCNQNDASSGLSTISEELLKSYFPYKTGDKVVYFNDLIGDMNYTVLESSSRTDNDKIIIALTMTGAYNMGVEIQAYTLALNAELTDKHLLKIDYFLSSANGDPQENSMQYSTKGTYSFDAENGEDLPETIILSNGSLLKRNEGLTYFIDYDDEKWYFKKRL